MPGYISTKENRYIEFADGTAVLRVNVLDYVATMIAPVGSPERSSLFTKWESPMVPNFDVRRREAVLSRISDFSVKPIDRWVWVIASVAASHAEAVIELTYNDRDYHFGGPWIVHGFDLENPIKVESLMLIQGYVDRRRCGPGSISVWLRGFLYRRER